MLPSLKTLLESAEERRMLLLGNDAIARGVLEAGVGVVTTYPGTPASEIGDAISEIAADAGVYMEYSANEMVAVQVAAGAANCGVRALTAMKHVGLNVAADMLMTLAYTGVRGGYVIVTADDPECYSSQNEQDNRFYSLLSNLPCFEPSEPQEAKDMTVSAVQISEKLELPVLLRTTTRVNHMRAPVVFGKLKKPKLRGEFIRDLKRFNMVPAFSRPRHTVLLRQSCQAKEISENSPFNKLVRKGGRVGVVSSGSAFNYAAEAADLLGLDSGILKIGVTHPLPERLIARFLRDYGKVVVVEELEPFLEMQVRAISNQLGLGVEIAGKMGEEFFSREGELSTRSAAIGLARATGRKLPIDLASVDRKYVSVSKDLPSRPPVLCAGCPHRASFYDIRRAFGDKALYPTDIGCYALGISPPLSVGDIMICMGASVGIAQGISRVTDKDTIAVIGDSTFFHAALPGLVNAVYNRSRIVVAVLDNEATAMTGHQPHPGTGVTGMGVSSKKVLVEKVAEGCGVDYVRVVNPFETRKAEKILKEAVKCSGPSVVVLRSSCTLMVLREKRRRGLVVSKARVTEKCAGCLVCVKLLGCPAIVLEAGKPVVDEEVCSGCGLCVSVCPAGAIEGGCLE